MFRLEVRVAQMRLCAVTTKGRLALSLPLDFRKSRWEAAGACIRGLRADWKSVK